jgi:hypothetical protein
VGERHDIGLEGALRGPVAVLIASCGEGVTRSPGLNRVTPAPTSATSPARSSPSTAGRFIQGATCWLMNGRDASAQSTGLIATARLRMTISPSPGGV